MTPLRRHLLIVGAAGLVVRPGWAQTAARPQRIGWPARVPIRTWNRYPAFNNSMRQPGWVEGRDHVMDDATYDGRAERIPAAVAELMSRKHELLVGSGTPPMRALMAASSTIPIVMFAVGDPLGQGFVPSLARPGGNVTGLSSLHHGMLGKQFELLLQATPRARRIGVTYNPNIPPHVTVLREVEAAAARLGVMVRPAALRSPTEVDAAIDMLRREQVDAVHLFAQTWINTGGAKRLACIALQQRWPTAMALPQQARAGILLSYGFLHEEQLRRLAYFVDRIVRGAPPGELPVELPTRIRLVLNLKTSKAPGLALPQSLVLQADEVIE